MDYCALPDLIAKFGLEAVTLAAYDATIPGLSPARVQAAIDAASAKIDGWLGQRYTLPLALAPNGTTLLTGVCADLAMIELATTPETATETLIARAKAATDFLKAVAAGAASVPVIPSDPTPPLSPNQAMIAGEDRVFTRDALRRL